MEARKTIALWDRPNVIVEVEDIDDGYAAVLWPVNDELNDTTMLIGDVDLLDDRCV